MCDVCTTDRGRVVSQSANLDKLAQVGTGISETQKSYQDRARSKAMTNSLVERLVKVEGSSLKKAYYRSFTCTHYLVQDGQKVTAKYCNGRWCFVCNRIRCMKLIKGYSPAIEEMEQPVFVTLTHPAVEGDKLKDTIDEMGRGLSRIIQRFRKREQRGKSNVRVVGIRKLECNHKMKKGTFNPHYHFLLDGMLNATALVEEWLKEYPDCNEDAQDVTLADPATVSKELFKYFTKIISKTGVDANALNTIFEAMYGKRTFQPYGGIRKVSEDVDQISSQEIDFKESRVEVWVWERQVHDWVSPDGELFSDFKPNDVDLNLIKYLSYKDGKPPDKPKPNERDIMLQSRRQNGLGEIF